MLGNLYNDYSILFESQLPLLEGAQLTRSFPPTNSPCGLCGPPF